MKTRTLSLLALVVAACSSGSAEVADPRTLEPGAHRMVMQPLGGKASTVTGNGVVWLPAVSAAVTPDGATTATSGVTISLAGPNGELVLLQAGDPLLLTPGSHAILPEGSSARGLHATVRTSDGQAYVSDGSGILELLQADSVLTGRFRLAARPLTGTGRLDVRGVFRTLPMTE